MSEATTVTTVIKGDTFTEASRPTTSWPGFVHVIVWEPGHGSALDIYITDDRARALAEQITAALAERVEVTA
jgi:hypothetical protein